MLPGEGDTDYARYMRVGELLSLQRTSQHWVHPDELSFQITHQSTELWLKLATSHVDRAAAEVEIRRPRHAVFLLENASLHLRLITDQLQVMRRLNPADFQTIRTVLGNGSGLESPGWRSLRTSARLLGRIFDDLLAAEHVDLVELYRGDPTTELYSLAEALIELDERIALWRTEHYKIATRVIGHAVLGTQGTPVDSLARLITHQIYPRLWAVRTQLTATGPRGNDTSAGT